MKLAWLVIATLCVMHVLALLGVVGWAAATQRLDRERIAAAADLFRMPVGSEDDDAADVDEEVAADAEATVERAEQALDDAAAESIADRLEADQLRNEMTLRQLERTREEVQSLTRNLQLSQQRVEEQQEELEAKRDALEARVAEIQEQLDDEGFRRTVGMLESLPPGQAKEMFVQMLDDQKHEQVVDYLMAMQQRRAAGVLREFETAEEVRQAVELTEMLRSRGSDVVAEVEGAL